MGPNQLWMWLLVTAAMTFAAMVIGAASANQALVVVAGLLFVIVAVVSSWWFAARAENSVATVSARFARLIALSWGWAGAAMLGCYYLTDLSWQHAWQYGLAMVLIAGGAVWYARQRESGAPFFASSVAIRTVRAVTMLQALAAIAGVVLLVLSDKLQPEGRDWAANIIFVTGGLVIFAQSMAALRAGRQVRGDALNS